jgi:hypothetical protein
MVMLIVYSTYYSTYHSTYYVAYFSVQRISKKDFNFYEEKAAHEFVFNAGFDW